MQLHTLLQNISDNKPVNFDQVIKRMPNYVDWRRVFRVEQWAKNKHSVEIVDHGLFDMLVKESLQPQTRAQAASLVISSSHDVKCDSAYMLCFPAPTASNHDMDTKSRSLTVVAVSQKQLLQLPFIPAKQAILIENQDCFFQYSAFIAHYYALIDLPSSDIYFSGGSRVLNHDLQVVLNQYKHIKCLFDYDLAGLQIAQSLASKGYKRLEYLVPPNIDAYASLFTFKPPSANSLAAMLSLCEKHGMGALGSVISQTKCFMEQEAMLTIGFENGMHDIRWG